METAASAADEPGAVPIPGAAPLGPAPPALHRRMASALDGDGAALRALLADGGAEHPIDLHRVGPALYAAAHELGLEGEAVERCHRAFVGEAGRWLVFRALLTGIGEALDAADVPWMPIKGMDTAERFFPCPELRPMSDMDVLVPFAEVAPAVQALAGAGWEFPSTPHLDSYQRDEGYNWAAGSANGGNLELHYRLWGSAPASLVDGCWRTAVRAPDLGSRAFRLAPEMAFVISAVHSWKRGNQPRLLDWWELKLIADRLADGAGVEAAARENGLELAVGLAAGYVGQLWDHPACTGVGRALLSRLRLAERAALRRVKARGIEAMTLERLTLTRLLARRPSRLGWRLVLRRAWPHPGTVERTTPGHVPWWKRRLMATLSGIGMKEKSTLRREDAKPPPTRRR